MVRTPCCEKIGLNKGLWSAEEDEILRSYIQANGEGSWRYLPKNAGLKRCGKSCRLRWVNYLRGDLMRGNITSEEEDIIIKMHNKIGNRWSVIAGHLPGRTDNEIKNYWNSYLSRRIYTIKRAVGESSSSPTTLIVDIVKLDCGRKPKGRTRTAKKKNNNNSQEILSNAKIHHGPNIESENAGKILNSSDDGIETMSWSSSPFANGEPESEILGANCLGLDQSSMFADDDIMSDELLSPSDILCLNEKDNEINTMSERENGGGLSLVSNGHGAAQSSDEWTNSDREGVDGFNHKLLTNERGDELFSWLWDNIDSGNEEDMLGACEEQIKAIAGSLLS